jgi:hypothetical protein
MRKGGGNILRRLAPPGLPTNGENRRKVVYINTLRHGVIRELRVSLLTQYARSSRNIPVDDLWQC